MQIRWMTQADLPAVAELEKSAPDPWKERELAEELASPFARCLVLCESVQAAPVGFCTVQCAAGEASLNAITVVPEKRGIGYGFALLSALEERLCREGVEELFLEVRTQNAPAIALYTKAGYLRTGLRRGFYRNPPDDAYTMKKSLQPR